MANFRTVVFFPSNLLTRFYETAKEITLFA